MIQDLQQLRFFESRNGLTWFIMIHKDHFEPRWIEEITLARNSTIQAMVINHPVVVVFIAQNTIEKITDVPIDRKLRYICICGIPTWGRHHLPYCGIAGLRTEYLGEIPEEAKAIDDPIRLSIFIYYRRDTTCTTGESPCHAQLCVRAQAIQPLHHCL